MFETTSYWYNRSWHKLDTLANGPLVRLAIAIPLVGYLVIFNDAILQNLSFIQLTGRETPFIFETKTRLRMIYFGLIFLALGNIWYLYRRPGVLTLAISPDEYVHFGIKNFVIYDFVQIFGIADDRNTGPITNYWEFGKSDLEKFIKDAEGNQRAYGAGASASKDMSFRRYVNNREQAIENHSEFIRSLLLEYFARATRVRKSEQQAVLTVSILGYLLLAIPSLELFAAVVSASFL